MTREEFDEALAARRQRQQPEGDWRDMDEKDRVNLTFLDRVDEQQHAVKSHYTRFARYEDGCRIDKMVRITQKFICLGGPKDTQWLTEEAAMPLGYARYAGNGWNRSRRNDARTRNVLVHESVWQLQEPVRATHEGEAGNMPDTTEDVTTVKPGVLGAIVWRVVDPPKDSLTLSRDVGLEPGDLLKDIDGKVWLVGDCSTEAGSCNCCDLGAVIVAMSDSLRLQLRAAGVLGE